MDAGSGTVGVTVIEPTESGSSREKKSKPPGAMPPFAKFTMPDLNATGR